MLFLQFALSFSGTMQQAKDRHVGMRAGWSVEMASDREVWVMLADRPKVFCKAVTQSAFGLTNVEETALGTANAVD